MNIDMFMSSIPDAVFLKNNKLLLTIFKTNNIKYYKIRDISCSIGDIIAVR